MEKQVIFASWYVVDGPMGTEYIDSDLVDGALDLADYQRNPLAPETFDIPPKLADYCENTEAYEITFRDGWGARFSEPGTLDCTSWSVFDTEQEAEDSLDDE